LLPGKFREKFGRFSAKNLTTVSRMFLRAFFGEKKSKIFREKRRGFPQSEAVSGAGFFRENFTQNLG